MHPPGDRYRRTERPNHLELHSFDGTCHGVLFEDASDAERAMLTGRAKVDRGAIEIGFLPSGAHLVFRAGPSRELGSLMVPLDADGAPGDPFDLVRLRFSVSLLAGRTKRITTDTDATARARQPSRFAGYDATIASMDEREARG